MLFSGFREVYDDLNKKISDELGKQEIQQKILHDKIDKVDNVNFEINEKVVNYLKISA